MAADEHRDGSAVRNEGYPTGSWNVETHFTPEQARRYIANKWPDTLGRPTGVPTWTAEDGIVAAVDCVGWCQEVADDHASYCYERVRVERGPQPKAAWRVVSRRSERAVEEHDLGVLSNLYEVLRHVAGEAAWQVNEAAGTSGEEEDAGASFEGDDILDKYLQPLLQPELRGEVSRLAEQVAELYGFWGVVHRHMDDHWGRRTDSRRPLLHLVQSLWNHQVAGVDLTETQISMVLMGLDVPDISKTVAPGFEKADGGEEKWFQLKTVRNVVRKAVKGKEGAKRRRVPKSAQGPTGG